MVIVYVAYAWVSAAVVIGVSQDGGAMRGIVAVLVSGLLLAALHLPWLMRVQRARRAKRQAFERERSNATHRGRDLRRAFEARHPEVHLTNLKAHHDCDQFSAVLFADQLGKLHYSTESEGIRLKRSHEKELIGIIVRAFGTDPWASWRTEVEAVARATIEDRHRPIPALDARRIEPELAPTNSSIQRSHHADYTATSADKHSRPLDVQEIYRPGEYGSDRVYNSDAPYYHEGAQYGADGPDNYAGYD